MKVFDKTAFFIGLFVLLCGCALLGISRPQVSYRGTEIFTTENDYKQFRQELANAPLYSVKEITVQTSEPPIIVNFDFQVERDYEFPYGQRFALDITDLASLAVVGMGGYLMVVGVKTDKKEGKENGRRRYEATKPTM